MTRTLGMLFLFELLLVALMIVHVGSRITKFLPFALALYSIRNH